MLQRKTLLEEPLEVMKQRVSKEWTQLAKELDTSEAELRNSINPTVRSVLGNKRLRLLEKVAGSLDWPNKGRSKRWSKVSSSQATCNTGVFAHDVKPATLAEGLLGRC